MFHLKRIAGMIACMTAACVLSFGICGNDVSAEQGASIIINGIDDVSSGADGAAASSADTGNSVIIIGPTAMPAPTAAPDATAAGDATVAGTDSQSASINIDESTGEVYVDEENSDSDYYVDDSDSSSSAKSNSDSSAKKNSKSTSSAKKTAVKSANYNESVPKTGVVRWEFMFAGIGILLLAAGTILSVRYMRRNGSHAG
jgi:hypothetical protein